jgi:hypothetical protein
MLRTLFALAVAGLLFAGISGTAQAAPMAPLPAGITAEHGLTPVYWHHWHHRHCWRGRWGYVHCDW